MNTLNARISNPHQSTQQSRLSTFNLGIRGTLFVGFGIGLLILLIVMGIVLVKTTETESSANRVINLELPTYDTYLDLNGQLYQSQTAVSNWLLTHDPKFKNQFDVAWVNISRMQGLLDSFSKYWPEEYLQRWLEVKLLINQLRITEEKYLTISADHSISTPAIIAEIGSVSSKLLDTLDGPLNATGNRTGGIYNTQHARLENGNKQIINQMNSIRILEYYMLIIGALFFIIITLLTTRKILRPLNSAINVANQIAAGERNVDIVITSNDETGKLLTALAIMQSSIQQNEDKLRQNEITTRNLLDSIIRTAKLFSTHSSKIASGDLRERLLIPDEESMVQLGHDLNTMTESLATMTRQVIAASHNMFKTLNEVKSAVNAQSTGATEQAAAINQITSSLSEIEKSSCQTMDKAKQLGEVAERTREKGEQGLVAVEQSIDGMNSVREKVQLIAQTILDLNHQTQQVGEITAVVNTLAQQLKMLALNASIEAVKAGESGKGFAVVASEVKNLAEQSEQATVQVQKILEDIRHSTEKAVIITEEGTKSVDNGRSLAEQTGEIVRGLNEVIHETTIASQQIGVAVHQESVGIEQITAGMNEINQVTASFVASVTQTNGAITNLVTIAQTLKEYVDLYQTESVRSSETT